MKYLTRALESLSLVWLESRRRMWLGAGWLIVFQILQRVFPDVAVSGFVGLTALISSVAYVSLLAGFELSAFLARRRGDKITVDA